jgi:Oxidoreductase molybdopterin binding domain
MGSRRAFLGATAAVAAGAAMMAAGGRALKGRFSAAESRANVTLPRPARPLPPVPAGVEAGVDGIAPFVTPNRDFYRIDTALIVPQVRAEDWTLRVTGMVDRPFELTYGELAELDIVEADITMTCVSNPVGGDLIGHARWLGVLTRDVLDRAGVRRGADQVVGRCAHHAGDRGGRGQPGRHPQRRRGADGVRPDRLRVRGARPGHPGRGARRSDRPADLGARLPRGGGRAARRCPRRADRTRSPRGTGGGRAMDARPPPRLSRG